MVRVATDLAPSNAWAAVWDLDAHTAVIPFTTVTLTPPSTALDTDATFTGRTALGPIGFDDPMQVLVWEPPTTGSGRAVVAKTGRVIGGRIEAIFEPVAGGGTAITWRQQVELGWLPSSMSGVEGLAARAVAPGYRWVLRRLLARAGSQA